MFESVSSLGGLKILIYIWYDWFGFFPIVDTHKEFYQIKHYIKDKQISV